MKSLREVIEDIWKDHFCAWDIKHKGRETGRVCELYRHGTDIKNQKSVLNQWKDMRRFTEIHSLWELHCEEQLYFCQQLSKAD